MRKGVDGPKLTYKAAVDEALCFGWIDGIRKKIDDVSYTNRFTPRRPRSNWSNINIARVGELTAEGRMHPAGLAAFEARTPERSGVYSFEQREPGLPPEFEAAFRADPAAWTYFEAQPAHYRRISAHWVMSAKRDETRQRRLKQLMADSAAGEWISMLRR
jgi:uncharacterized protein YdeI (YjbR/CyaY-like superfamily)